MQHKNTILTPSNAMQISWILKTEDIPYSKSAFSTINYRSVHDLKIMLIAFGAQSGHLNGLLSDVQQP
jgi:hypothetical protein